MDEVCISNNGDTSGNRVMANETASKPAAKMGFFTQAEDERAIIRGGKHASRDVKGQEGDEPGPRTFREKLKAVIHSHRFHVVVIVLVALDCIFVVLELILDYEALMQSCSTPGNETIVKDTHEEEETSSPVQRAAEGLHIISLCILSIFMVELCIKLFALGLEFFHSKLEIFDGVVIIVSFVLDIVTLVYAEQFAAVDFIVILRLWRIIRVVNGVILSVEQNAERSIKRISDLKTLAIQTLSRFEEYSTTLETRISVMEGLLQRNGVDMNEMCAEPLPERPERGEKLHSDTEDQDSHHESPDTHQSRGFH